MKLTGKKPWYLEYLLIIVGTGLMATAITSCFDAAGMVTGGFSGIAILVKAGNQRGVRRRNPALGHEPCIERSVCFYHRRQNKGLQVCKKSTSGRSVSLTFWLAFLPAWKLSGDLLLVALIWRTPAGNRYRICFPWRRNDRWNRYAGSHHPEISEPLFHRADHAVY